MKLVMNGISSEDWRQFVELVGTWLDNEEKRDILLVWTENERGQFCRLIPGVGLLTTVHYRLTTGPFDNVAFDNIHTV